MFNGTVSFVARGTGSENTRWLGLRASQNGGAVELHGVTVETALEQQDPYREPGENFQFVSPADLVKDLMGQFTLRPTLEAISVKEDRNRRKPIEGIMTQWDAARFTQTRATVTSER